MRMRFAEFVQRWRFGRVPLLCEQCFSLGGGAPSSLQRGWGTDGATSCKIAIRARNRFRIACLLLVAISLVGCAPRKRSFQPPVDPATLDDAAFLHYLATVPVVTVDEGARGLLLLIGPTNNFPTFEARTAELERRSAYRSAWRLSADDVLDRGTLAYALVPLCDTPASINTTAARITGIADRRAALQVCVYQELLPFGQPTSPVNGGEFLAALDAAERTTMRPGGTQKPPRP